MVVDAVMASHTTTASYLDTLKKRTKLSKNVAMPDFLVHPTNRDNALKCGETWLSGKVVDDDIGDLNLWRVHDKLYDLTDFAKKHPGGAFWLDMTRGTDITEAFEASHIDPKVQQLLRKFEKGPAKGSRKSPYTFADDGFYQTLKRRVYELLKNTPEGPSQISKKVMDGTALSFGILALLAGYFQSTLAAALAGALLALTVGAAHNFFHQRDNWRMYYFELSFLHVDDWRVTHALSHHMFTNTVQDIEMAALEPYLIFTPSVLRYYVHHFASVYIQLLAGILMYIEQAKYFIRLCMGLATFKLTHLIVYAEIPVLVYLSGSVSAGVWLWAVIQATASWVFINLSFVITTHHHDEIWHQGDTTISGDFGLLQAEATRDRLECVHSPFAMYMFGDHVLHHLFPCVDHGYLEVLYPVLLQTLEEFGVEATLLRYSMWESVKGFARQTVREYEHHISTIARRSKVE